MTLNYNSPAALRAFLETRGLGMRKKYGQNFLVDPSAREKLLCALDCPPGSPVWEVGPGLGAMTAGLLARGLEVTAFEIDPAFAEALRELLGDYGNFTLIEGDVFKTWPAAPGERPYFLGNLPYNIAASLIGDFIEKGKTFARMALTVQEEVGRRMTAGPGDRDYSSLSVLCASAYTVKPLCLLKGSAFYPAPRVNSLALRLDPREDLAPPPPLFYKLLRALFASRRKTINNNLKAFIFSLNPAILKEGRASPEDIALGVFRDAGIDRELRAEALSLKDFIALEMSLRRALDGGL